jgi:ParB-like chromosome segregation protein Spo0J
LCSVKRFGDRKAAILHFAENVDRAELSALAKGRFFQRYMKKFRVSERETAKILGVSPSQISLCVGLAETSEGVFRGLNRSESVSLEPVVTMTKYAAVSALPTRQKVAILREAVRRRLSDSETRRVAAEVRSGKDVELAASSVVEARRDRKRRPDAAAGSASGRVICSNCRRPVIIEHLGNGRHRIMADVK